MSKNKNQQSRTCCRGEHKRLMQDLRSCDYCSTSYEQYQECYSQAARVSGERSQSCMASS